ncbi:MAG: DNA polymerase III subunit delta [Thermodesulfobacteriota bacterium]
MKRDAEGSFFQGWLGAAPASAYLLYGAGAGLAGLLAAEWERKLRAEGIPFETFRWTMTDFERESPTAAWRSPSFFSRIRIFVLPDLSETKKAHRDEIKSYLESPEPSAMLILHGTDFRQAKTFSGAPNLLSAAPREEQALDALARHATAVAKRSGSAMSRDSAAFLARWTGGSFEALDAELGKVLAFAAGREAVTEEDIRAVCVFRGEVNPFHLAEALVRKDAAACLAMLRRFSESAKDEEYHQLTGAIAWHLRERVRGKGGAVAPARAAEIFEALSRIDRELKGESRLSPRQVYEIRLLSVL